MGQDVPCIYRTHCLLSMLAYLTGAGTWLIIGSGRDRISALAESSTKTTKGKSAMCLHHLEMLKLFDLNFDPCLSKHILYYMFCSIGLPYTFQWITELKSCLSKYSAF